MRLAPKMKIDLFMVSAGVVKSRAPHSGGIGWVQPQPPATLLEPSGFERRSLLILVRFPYALVTLLRSKLGKNISL